MQAAQQWPSGQVQAALRLVAQRFGLRVVSRLALPEQRLIGLYLAVVLGPATVALLETQAQAIVMRHQRLQSLFQQLWIKRTQQLQIQRLVPVRRLRLTHGEEMRLDRRQRQFAGDRFLRDFLTGSAGCLGQLGQAGNWNSSRGASCNPCWRTRLTTCKATMESPPSSKK